MTFRKCSKNNFQMQIVYQTHCWANYWATKYIKTHLFSRLFIMVSIINLMMQTRRNVCNGQQVSLFIISTNLKANLCLFTLSTQDHPRYYFTSSTTDRGSWLRPFCNSLFTIDLILIMQTKSNWSIFRAINYEIISWNVSKIIV